MESSSEDRRSDLGGFLRSRLRLKERYGVGLIVGFLLTLAGIILFAMLGFGLVGPTHTYEADRYVQHLVQPAVTDGGTDFFHFVTNLGGTRGTLLFAVPLGLVLLYRRLWWSLWALILASGVGGIVSESLKLVFQRTRPLEQIIPVHGYSFPSGHAFAAAVFFGFCIYLTFNRVQHRVGRSVLMILCLVMMLAIGFSRIYLNVHYFSDVVGGIVAGLVWLTVTIYGLQIIEKRRSRSGTTDPST